MKTWEVIKYLIENPDFNVVFVSIQNGIKYDIYLDDYTKEIFIDELKNTDKGWIHKTQFSNFEVNRLLQIDNWS